MQDDEDNQQTHALFQVKELQLLQLFPFFINKQHKKTNKFKIAKINLNYNYIKKVI